MLQLEQIPALQKALVHCAFALHAPPLGVVPTHCDAIQAWPGAQTFPQAPQLLRSEVTLTHEPLQAVRPEPGAQEGKLLMHLPLWHTGTGGLGLGRATH